MLRFVSKTVLRAGWPASSDGHLVRLSGRRALTRRDCLILFAAFDGAPEGLDPVRIQEGLFLFSRCPGVPPRSKYAFEPGIYGPVSDELYSDLDRLVDERLIEPMPVKGASWFLYKPGEPMLERAREILRKAEDGDPLETTRRLSEIKEYVSNVGFGELLAHVYSEHPEFAIKSVFRGAA